MRKLRIMSIFGTRPEVIKFAPVLNALRKNTQIESIIAVTGQHKEMLEQMLSLCDLQPQINLEVMQPNQTLAQLTATVLQEIDPVLAEYQPDRVLVQGDTSTGFAAALASFYRKIPVGHIEAGLRSYNMHSPWPEEFNRSAISLASDMHFVASDKALENLVRENKSITNIYTTGNTIIDALHYFTELLENNAPLLQEMREKFSFIDKAKKLLLVTMHRRENHDGGIENVCEALVHLANREDTQIFFPVHLNPKVREPVERMLNHHPNIHLSKPLDYLEFIYMMKQSYLIVSDSGGVQEEAPSFKKPVLVLRDNTERQEGVEANATKLVGTDTYRIIKEASLLLSDEKSYIAMQQAGDLYGDGKASERIIQRILYQHSEEKEFEEIQNDRAVI